MILVVAPSLERIPAQAMNEHDVRFARIVVATRNFVQCAQTVVSPSCGNISREPGQAVWTALSTTLCVISIATRCVSVLGRCDDVTSINWLTSLGRAMACVTNGCVP